VDKASESCAGGHGLAGVSHCVFVYLAILFLLTIKHTVIKADTIKNLKESHNKGVFFLSDTKVGTDDIEKHAIFCRFQYHVSGFKLLNVHLSINFSKVAVLPGNQFNPYWPEAAKFKHCFKLDSTVSKCFVYSGEGPNYS